MTGMNPILGELLAAATKHEEKITLVPAVAELLDHQRPPEGDWPGWLMLAGRGSGKTAAAAHYVTQHVNGPPCLPGPVPHTVALIAPTLGDASAAVNGPAGLRAYTPSLHLALKPGGLITTYPNGAEVKLFGAHTESDVDRLRAGGNRCIAQGELVRTERGQVPIEQVTTDDRVWTRNGLRRVLATWDNGIRSVRQYHHQAGSTWMTDDHRVWTNQGWQTCAEIEPDDTVLTWVNMENQSSLMECTGTLERMDITSTNIEACCTGTCGNRRMDRSLTGNTSTTSIITKQIIESKISCLCHQESTGTSMVKNVERTGIRLEGKLLGQVLSIDLTSVGNAEINFVLGRRSTQNTVQTDVVTLPLRHERRSDGCALCAVLNSGHKHEVSRAHVRESALRSSDTVRASRVYDLAIEDDHEFFANNLLVANCLVWFDELAAARYIDAAWDNMLFGLRSGRDPRWIATTTPRTKKLIKELEKDETIAITRATTDDNPFLPERVRKALFKKYHGTSKGLQELEGKIVEEVEGALWQRKWIEENRLNVNELDGGVAELKAMMSTIMVGVDPSGGAGEQGIIVVGKGQKGDGRGYVLADYTCRLSPGGWAKRVIEAYEDWEADLVVVERNYGGDMVKTTVAGAARDQGIDVTIREVTATRGKRVRAEPVSQLSENGQLVFANVFPELEDQLCTWTPDESYSPDRMDAMVWPLYQMRLVSRTTTRRGSVSGRVLQTGNMLTG